MERKPYVRTRNLFDPQSKAPYRLSRSRLENFMRCPRCFYLDRRLGVDQPSMPGFTLNTAVDELLKKEFDQYRNRATVHPLCEKFGIKAVPFAHPMMGQWRENFKGISYHYQPANLIISGAVDDIWVDEDKRLYVVDYKATSTSEPITLESEYRQAYKRQMEIYQWLLRRQNFDVSDTGYFVYCNADKNKQDFSYRLEFGIEIIFYKGNDGWVEGAIEQAHQCLMGNRLPDYTPGCEYCEYRKSASKVENRQPLNASFQGELFS